MDASEDVSPPPCEGNPENGPGGSVPSIETEFRELDTAAKWPVLYQQIRNQCLKYDYGVNEAKKTQNRNLNRYRDVSPYDHSRVVLSEGNCDYINASLIQMEKAHRKYILTQGPLPHTAGHFWQMVWEQRCRAVLMLNRVVEKNQIKCHQYWPLGTGDSPTDMPDVGLRIEYLSEEGRPCYVLRTLRMTCVSSGESREVLHFHYTTWPDFGVPQSPTAFLNFLLHVRRCGALNQNVGPPVVHCSAGIGRSGTFCLVDSCLVLIEESENEPVDVKEVLLEMRRYRMGLIQTPDQLRFSYQAIIEGAKFLSTHSEEEDIPWTTPHSNHVLCGEEGGGRDPSLSESDSDQSSEGPPPLPPPRHESLSAPNMADNDMAASAPNMADSAPNMAASAPNMAAARRPLPEVPAEEEGESGDEDPPDRPLPSEPPRSYADANSDDDPARRDLRKRKRQEETDRISEKVRSMRKKQQKSEIWRQIRQSLIKPITIGLGLVLLGGGAYVAMRYFTAER